MALEILNAEELKKERATLKQFLFGYRYGMLNGKTPPEAMEMEKRFREINRLLRPEAKA